MPEQTKPFSLDYYLELALRFHWFIIIPFCLSMACGIFMALTLPKLYRAETLILVQPQKVPTDFVRSIVSSDIDSRVSTISQQIRSRTNLERIINEFRLFSDPEQAAIYLEDKLESLRKRISIDVTAARTGADAFSISFEGRDPEKVMQVANALATYFIDENLKVREDQAVGTSDFLDSERVAMLRRLEDVENTLKEYRTRYMGELPEQLDSNLSILSRLQERESLMQQRLRDAENRLLAFEAEHRGAENAVLDDLSDLDRLRAQLADLQTRYTSRHPDVMALESRILELEEGASEEQTQGEGAGPPSVSTGSSSAGTHMGSARRRQLDAMKAEVRATELEISNLQSQIEVYEARVEATPKREQELMSLQRDYDNILASYNSLLSRKLEAEIAVNMEKKQKGEQFRIVDRAKRPEKPIAPDMRKIFMLALAAGLGMGGGLVFAWDYLNTSFKDKGDVEPTLGLPLLSTIPTLANPTSRKWKILDLTLSMCAIAVSIVLCAAFGALALLGRDKVLELARELKSMV